MHQCISSCRWYIVWSLWTRLCEGSELNLIANFGRDCGRNTIGTVRRGGVIDEVNDQTYHCQHIDDQLLDRLQRYRILPSDCIETHGRSATLWHPSTLASALEVPHPARSGRMAWTTLTSSPSDLTIQTVSQAATKFPCRNRDARGKGPRRLGRAILSSSCPVSNAIMDHLLTVHFEQHAISTAL